MKIHRFYISPKTRELDHSFWLHDPSLIKQWVKVLRYQTGQELVLFDGISHDRLYKLTKIEPDSVHLEMVTEFERKLPSKSVYLFWSLLKKDKNEWVVQKATEIGVSNFVPVLADRSEKTGFNLERAQKIAIEASEQCGRSDIPHIRDTISLTEALDEYKDKVTMLVCDEQAETNLPSSDQDVGVLIGPEGGWSDNELALFKQARLGNLHLGQLTLRAETAAVIAAAKLIQ